VEVIPHVAAVISVIVGTGGITIMICIGLWLRRGVINGAVKRGGKPDRVETIWAASLGMIGRSAKPPASPSLPKSDDTSVAT
jgi:hypothetical protein